MRTLRAAGAVALTLACAPAAPAGWTSSGPAGGQISALAIDSSNPSILYAGSLTSGVFKSTDSGASWAPALSGLGSLEILGLAIDPVTPSTLYAASASGNVWKSTDSGGTWFSAAAGLPNESITAIAIDPSNPATLYAGGFGDSNPPWANPEAVFKSTDGGASWSAAGLQVFPLVVNALRIDPSVPGTVYAATSASGVVRTTDGGVTWTSTSARQPAVDVLALALDSMSPPNLYAGSGGRTQVYSSTDQGTSWSAGGSALSPSAMINAIAADPSTPSTLYAASQFGGMQKSTDSGATWTGINQGLPSSTPLLSVAMDPATPSTLYAGSGGSGVWKSTDGGTTWALSSSGLNADPVISLDVDPQDPLTAYAGMLVAGSFETTDGGGTWTPLALSSPGDLVPAIAVAPSLPSTIYAGRDNSVMKSTDSGGSWAAMTSLCTPQPPYFFGCPAEVLVVDPTSPNTVYASSGLIQKSTDGGMTWNGNFSGFSLFITNSISIDPTSPSNIYAGGGGYPSDVNKSTDSGSTWSSTFSVNAIVQTMAIDPLTPSVVYLGATSSSWPPSQPGAWKSTDSGGTWVNTSSGMTNLEVNSLAADPGFPSALYAATSGGGVFLSTNGAATWSAFNEGLTCSSIESIFADSMSRHLYAGADTGGVFTQATCFQDVPLFNAFVDFICTLARDGVSAGCGAGNFCPADSVLRSQMAVFLLRGEHGSAYVPPTATGIFADVPASNAFGPWIEELYNEGITGGCSTNPLLYCPNNDVSRAGMAVFLLVAEHGTGYVPPACVGIFTDVACPGPFTNWIEELYNEGVTGGCNINPLMYCPANFVTRAQVSVFLTVTFALP